MKKYFVINLEERNGEQTYRQHVLTTGTSRTNTDKMVDKILRKWYDSKPESDGFGGYYHLSGCVHIRFRGLSEVSQAEYEVLTKYL